MVTAFTELVPGPMDRDRIPRANWLRRIATVVCSGFDGDTLPHGIRRRNGRE